MKRHPQGQDGVEWVGASPVGGRAAHRSKQKHSSGTAQAHTGDARAACSARQLSRARACGAGCSLARLPPGTPARRCDAQRAQRSARLPAHLGGHVVCGAHQGHLSFAGAGGGGGGGARSILGIGPRLPPHTRVAPAPACTDGSGHILGMLLAPRRGCCRICTWRAFRPSLVCYHAATAARCGQRRGRLVCHCRTRALTAAAAAAAACRPAAALCAGRVLRRSLAGGPRGYDLLG